MDWEMFAILAGLTLSGVIIGYVIGYAVGIRHESLFELAREPKEVRQARKRLDSILDAEILEEKCSS